MGLKNSKQNRSGNLNKIVAEWLIEINRNKTTDHATSRISFLVINTPGARRGGEESKFVPPSPDLTWAARGRLIDQGARQKYVSKLEIFLFNSIR